MGVVVSFPNRTQLGDSLEPGGFFRYFGALVFRCFLQPHRYPTVSHPESAFSPGVDLPGRLWFPRSAIPYWTSPKLDSSSEGSCERSSAEPKVPQTGTECLGKARVNSLPSHQRLTTNAFQVVQFPVLTCPLSCLLTCCTLALDGRSSLDHRSAWGLASPSHTPYLGLSYGSLY
jgi:hypothetical protein